MLRGQDAQCPRPAGPGRARPGPAPSRGTGSSPLPLEVGLARRTGDPAELARTWQAAREAILLQPIDLFVLLPLGEFVVAAAVMGESRAARHPTGAGMGAARQARQPGGVVQPAALVPRCRPHAVSQSTARTIAAASTGAASRSSPHNGYGRALGLRRPLVVRTWRAEWSMPTRSRRRPPACRVSASVRGRAAAGRGGHPQRGSAGDNVTLHCSVATIRGLHRTPPSAAVAASDRRRSIAVRRRRPAARRVNARRAGPGASAEDHRVARGAQRAGATGGQAAAAQSDLPGDRRAAVHLAEDCRAPCGQDEAAHRRIRRVGIVHRSCEC